MNKQSTREIGNKLEEWLVAYLEELDPKTKQSKNSGAFNNDGDILNKYFVIEAKHRNTKNVTLKSDTWRKLCGQIPVGSLKIPLYVLRNEKNETFAVLDFKDFLRMAKIVKEKNEGNL